MKRFFPAVLLFALSFFPVNGGIIFSDLDLSDDNLLLFRIDSGSGGVFAQDALFSAQLSGGNTADGFPLQQLTVFPEKMELLENGRTLQVRNVFGAVRLPSSGGLPMPVSGLPSFAGGNPALRSRAEEMTASWDGRWLLCLDPVSPALGNLVMIDAFSGAKTLIASRLERPERIFPASWSPDSRFFVYERDRKLYFYAADTSSVPANERIRLIGDGTMRSVSWSRGGDFYYFRGSTLYRVRGIELFTRSLYSDFLEIGTVAGKIPFEFDPCFDNFWLAPDARSVLVSKGHRSLFYYPLDSGAAETTLPYMLLPRSCSDINVLWSGGGTATVLISVPGLDDTDLKTWRLDLSPGKRADFVPLPPPSNRGLLAAGGSSTAKGSSAVNGSSAAASCPSGSLSPDGKHALFWGRGGILLYDYVNWKLLEVVSARPGTACVWTGNDEFIAGDEQKIERIRLSPGSPPATAGSAITGSATAGPVVAGRDILCLSRASRFGFEDGRAAERNSGSSELRRRILAKSGDDWFVTDGKNPWRAIGSPQLRGGAQASERYRVYTERQGNGLYANLPMIRNIASVGTFPLFPPGAGFADAAAGPSASDSRYTPGTVFSHGNRGGQREAALCFDLYDDDQGLPEVLEALGCFGIKATFFLNGEFIRRHPLAVSDIAGAGHEIASMFYAPIDLSDTRYQASPDFIARGLARNEDEYFRVTGKELSLLWHPPWYTVSTAIVSSAAGAGYTTSSRDIDPMDWVSRDDEKRLGIRQSAASDMVDRIMENVKPGSIVPVRLGLLTGGREDYLFSRINVLLDALFREGYTLTTVLTLMEHSRTR